MAQNNKISDFGLKLIKAYEGFRHVETTLVSGQKVIGYGHLCLPGEITVVTKKQADAMLRADLEPVEALVNTHVYAPLNQNQFDALVSFAFNIGRTAFLNSSVLHALNAGQPLAAANGFDVWCKSVIGGKTYIVDALVRRRAAEKALFLRTSSVVPAPRFDLPPRQIKRDDKAFIPEDVFENSKAFGVVERAPYGGPDADRLRREDGPAGILTLSERVDEPDTHQGTEHSTQEEQSPIAQSPIALAAAEVSARLDRLMEEQDEGRDATDILPDEDDIGQQGTDGDEDTKPPVTNEVTQSDESEEEADAPAPKTTEEAPNILEQQVLSHTGKDDEAVTGKGLGAYWFVLLIGLSLLGGGLWKLKFEQPPHLDELSAFLAPVAVFVGALMVLGGLYYLIKTAFRE